MSSLARVADAVLPAALAFWRWWVAELEALWPSHVALPFIDPTPVAEMRPYRDRVEIVRIGKSEGERLNEPIPVDRFDDTHWDEVMELVANRRTRVVLTPPLVHVLDLTLPKIARSRLGAAVPLQLRDHAPLRPDLLDWAVLRVEPSDEQRIRVLVVIVRRALLDVIADGFQLRDRTAPPILAEIDEETCVLRAGKESDGALSALSRPWAIAAAILVATPIVMLILLSILCAIETGRVADLDDVVRPKLATEQRLIEKAQVGRSLNAVVDLPTITAIVEDLAARLPQTASVQQITGDRNGVRMTLDETDPRGIAKLLERDPVLPEVRQIGEPRKAGDRFQTDYTATIR